MCTVTAFGLTLTYDSHERIKVPDVEALPSHIDEELNDLGTLLLLGRLDMREDMEK